MLQLWDLDHPLLSEDHIKKSTLSNSAPAQFTPPAFATTVNLVLRIIEARGLPLDSKGRGRNCVVVVEYNPTTGSAASKGKSSAAVNDSEKLRFETNVEMNTVTPMWNQQITLTVHNLSDPVTVVLFHRKEKSGLFGEEVKDEFLGRA